MRKRHPIHEQSSPSERARIDQQRHRKDAADELPEGFTVKSNGRDGTIYYREGLRTLELAYEADGTQPGVLVHVAGLNTWVLPAPQATTANEIARIRSALEDWARLQNGRMTFVSTDELIRPWEADEPG